MIVTTWGTRGSTPVAGPDKAKYGGNTTCVKIRSKCLPEHMSLCVDGGTGIVPYGKDLCRQIRIKQETTKEPLFSRSHRLVCLFTHYHWDHIQGIPLSPALYNPSICWAFYGYNPSSHEGPRQAVRTLLRPPYFPVGFHQLGRRLDFVPITSYPQESVIIFHPRGEDVLMPLDEFEKIDASKKTIGFGPRGSYPVDECLVVKMCKSNHPEFTISYRFEERPTGRVFVFLTDHEVTAAFSNDFLRHVRGAHLLIADAQYSQERYPKGAAGFGHGTGPYCVQLAKEAGVRILGLTHHDPNSSDHDVESILSEALEETTSVFPPQGDTENPKMCPIVVFSCSDYQQIPV